MQKFHNFIQELVPLTSEMKDSLNEHCKIEILEKNNILLREGQVCHRMYFLESGTARTYYYHKGKDITSWMYREGLPFCSWGSFLNRTPAFEYIEILETSNVVSISFENLQKLYNTHPNFERFGRKLYERQIAFIDSYFRGFLFMSAKEKYEVMLEFFPDILQRVNLGHIASFLGISQETLSRIRGKK